MEYNRNVVKSWAGITRPYANITPQVSPDKTTNPAMPIQRQ